MKKQGEVIFALFFQLRKVSKMIQKTLFLSLSVLISTLFLGHSVYAQLESIDIGLNMGQGDVEDKPGSTEWSEAMLTMTAWGWDIWGDIDGFRYAYTEVSGDFEAEVHLISFEPINEWSKAGIMVRQDLDPGAVNMLATVTGGGASGSQITWRLEKDQPTSEFFDIVPGEWFKGCWLKIARTGNLFNGYISKNGAKWEDMLLQEVEMTDPIFIGLAVTACTAIESLPDIEPPVTAVFDQFSITQNGEKKIFAAEPEKAVKPEGSLSATWGAIKSGS